MNQRLLLGSSPPAPGQEMQLAPQGKASRFMPALFLSQHPASFLTAPPSEAVELWHSQTPPTPPSALLHSLRAETQVECDWETNAVQRKMARHGKFVSPPQIADTNLRKRQSLGLGDDSGMRLRVFPNQLPAPLRHSLSSTLQTAHSLLKNLPQPAAFYRTFWLQETSTLWHPHHAWLSKKAPLLQGHCCKLSIFSTALGSVVQAAPLSTPHNGTAQGTASSSRFHQGICPLNSMLQLRDRAEPRPGTRKAAARQAAGPASSEAEEGHSPRWPLLLQTL